MENSTQLTKTLGLILIPNFFVKLKIIVRIRDIQYEQQPIFSNTWDF